MTADPPLRALPGPRVVAIGGGHGLASSLRAARTYADEIVGIVSVADDGGSSGRLRRELGLPAPGDLRRCLTALASEDSLLAASLEHRFDKGALKGHPVGNLLLAGLASASGDFNAAVQEVARLVGATGTMYPATLESVTLEAESDAGPLRGQVTIERASGIRDLRLDPAGPASPPEAVAAILNADQVLIGPGSLFTSVLAAAIAPSIRAALLSTSARRIFVANVANDRAEAKGFDLPEHLVALDGHGVSIDVVIADPRTYRIDDVSSVVPNAELVAADVADGDRWSHDPAKLGSVLARLWAQRVGGETDSSHDS